MTKILSGYFDTTIGYKGESASYKRICESINLNPAEVLFLTDVETAKNALPSDSVIAIAKRLLIAESDGHLKVPFPLCLKF
ncbi:hypothetical protein TELCIR_23249 [Teladorsagia circumcincta]|uniref:Uncharacterized protein n=1 Tax=Teladorsagia circumcincta TaxID=45464 RepID=A0A2G9TBQ6_TELCI|nr:hypothetical protein TELCIR_23249 [Teladorsagia circumcincta]